MSYDATTALGALLSSTTDLVLFFDADGRYRFVGETAAALLGLKPADMIGRTRAEVGLPTKNSAHFEEQRLEVMRTGRVIRDEVAQGSGYLEYVVAPVVANGETIGTVVVTRDVTEHRRAEEALRASEAKFSIAFERSPLALTITSFEDGRLVEVNEGFIRMSGYTRGEAIGRRPEDLGLWVDPETRAQRFARLAAGEPVPDAEAAFRIKSGEVLIGVIGSALVDIEGKRCVLSSVVDITDRKRAENAKDEFLATLSHELRTPLTSAYGWVKLLGKARDPELIENGLRAIEESLTSQIRLIDELLDVSRVAAGKMHLDMHPLDLGAVVDSAIETIRPAAQSKRIELRAGTHPVLPVRGDAARLKQVAWNLLSNAVKFTPPGGVVEIELRADGDNAVLIVRDDGEGIDPKFLPHVFDRFRQADSSTSRRHGGLGIGLSIVASLVDAHNGSVRGESDGFGKGATFTVRIPLIAMAEGTDSAPARPPRSLAALGMTKVLVIDDDPATRQLMITTLEAAGAEVRECASATEAIDALSAWQPHVLISDIAMPLEDGYSLIRRIRETGNLVPAVAITAYVRSEDEARVRAAGFQRHVAKPFDPEELIDAVIEVRQPFSR